MDLTANLSDLASEVRDKKKKEKLKCTAYYMDDYNGITKFDALLHPSRKYAIIPELKRIQNNPIVCWDGMDNIIFIASKQHNLKWENIKDIAHGIKDQVNYQIGTLKLDDTQKQQVLDGKVKDIKLTEVQKKKLFDRLKYVKVWAELSVISEQCINWNIFKSKISEDFSADSHSILRSRILRVLEDATDFKALFIMILIYFFGFTSGFITEMLGSIILHWVW